jgi:uncharacterized delta-60 repeat protein
VHNTMGWGSSGTVAKAGRRGTTSSRVAAAAAAAAAAASGVAAAPAVAEPLESRRLLSAGDLDPTFGTAGVTSVGFTHGGFDGPIALDYANGKTVVAGGFQDAGAGPRSGFLARLDAAGKPDPTFGGGDGQVEVPTGFDYRGPDLGVQPDGGIILSDQFGPPVRYRPDGTPDPAFAPPSAGGSFIDDVAVAADGKVYVAVSRFNSDTDDASYVISPLNGATGQLDPSYGGGDGVAEVPGVGYGLTAVVPGPGGTLVVVGRPADGNDGRVLVARLRADGTPDPTFGHGAGRVLVDAGPAYMFAPAVAVDGSGRVVLALGHIETPDVTTLRLKPDGSTDTFFAPVSFATDGPAGSAQVSRVLVAADGKVVVVGAGPSPTGFVYPGPRYGSFIARYTPAGALDTSFGGGLGVQQSAGVGGSLPGADLLPDGRVVVAGRRPYGTGEPVGGPSGLALDVVRHQATGALPDASGVSLSADGTLRVAGTARANSVLVSDLSASGKPATLRVQADGSQRVFAKSAVKKIVVDAGGGNDGVRVDAGTFAAAATLLGGPGDDFLTGGPGDDRLDGGPGNDRLFGDAWTEPDPTGSHTGDDVLLGGDGPDELRGGDGNDTLDGGAGDDSLSGEGNGLGTGGDDSLRGGDGDDLLAGDGGDDTLDGGAGDDVLEGDPYDYGDGEPVPAGADVLRGGPGDDRLSGNAGPDRLDGGTGRDALDGGGGNDVLLGGDDADTLVGGLGDDRLDGNAGGDRLLGGGGTDTVDYAARTAGVVVDLADTFVGKEGAAGEGDTVYSDVEIVLGGSGDDVLRGSAANNSLYGNGGDDTLDGRGGDDLLVGGAGKDALYGGVGNDRLFGFSNLVTAGDGLADLLDGGAGADKGRKDDKDVVLSIETFV